MGVSKFLKKMISIMLTTIISLSCLSVLAYADNGESLEDKAIAGNFNDLKEVTIPATQIKLTSGQRKNLKIGSKYQITYTLKPKNSDDFVSYKSYNRNVAIVSEDGIVTAIGVGEARIQLKTSKLIKSDIFITVTDSNNDSDSSGKPDSVSVIPNVSKIELLDSSAMLRVGKTSLIESYFYPYGSSDTLTYSSSKESVATVSWDGLVTAVSDGSAVITVSTSKGITANYNVTVYSGILKGIDVSKWQGNIDWKKIRTSGIDFTMIRSSFGSQNIDAMLNANVIGCENNNIQYGFYHYTYAKSISEAKNEARYFLKTIQNYNPEYPVVLDIEESFYIEMGKKKTTDIVIAFMDILEEAGYYAMVYSYGNFFTKYLDMPRLKKYDIWVASWGDEEKLNTYYDYHYGMWQHSSTGRVNGISGDVDLNYAFKDYAEVIKRNGLNNFR